MSPSVTGARRGSRLEIVPPVGAAALPPCSIASTAERSTLRTPYTPPDAGHHSGCVESPTAPNGPAPAQQGRLVRGAARRPASCGLDDTDGCKRVCRSSNIIRYGQAAGLCRSKRKPCRLGAMALSATSRGWSCPAGRGAEQRRRRDVFLPCARRMQGAGFGLRIYRRMPCWRRSCFIAPRPPHRRRRAAALNARRTAPGAGRADTRGFHGGP